MQDLGRESLAARARHGGEDARGSAAVRERHGEKAQGSRELRDGRPGRQEGSAVRIRSDVGEQQVRSFCREVPEKGVRDLHGSGAPSPLDVGGLRARQLAGRDEPERADVEVELRAELVDRARRDRGDVGQARQGRVEAAHERIAFAVPALGIEEPRLVQGACRELRELLREPQLLRREGESSAARHREKAEHELPGVERQTHAEAARGIRARLVLERGAVRRKAAAQELVRVERAPAGRGPFAARRAALSEDLRDLFRLGMESISRDAVEFELASGAFLSLNPDEVIRLTVASLSRELEFDRVTAYRFHPETKEVTEILTQGGSTSGERPSSGRRPLDADELLGRSLSAHGPAFEDEPGSNPPRRLRMCLPLHAGELVFGFLTMSRRGGFALTPQELRLSQELAKLAAGALDKARLLDAERRHSERNTFVGRLHTALSGLTDVSAIASRTVDELGPQFNFDVCALRLVPAGELPGAQAAYVKGRGSSAAVEISNALLGHLATEGSHLLLTDVGSDPHGASLLPTGAAVTQLPAPLGLLAVPLAYRGAPAGVLAAVTGARGEALSSEVLHSFEALGVEVSLAITSARLLQQERESYRFLDRLREVGRSLSTTFDVDRIKQTLCEQSVTLLKADAAQFWDADPAAKAAKISTRWGADVGDEVGRAVAFEHTAHPIVRTFLDKTPCIAGPGEGSTFFPGNPEGAKAPLIRAAAVPLT